MIFRNGTLATSLLSGLFVSAPDAKRTHPAAWRRTPTCTLSVFRDLERHATGLIVWEHPLEETWTSALQPVCALVPLRAGAELLRASLSGAGSYVLSAALAVLLQSPSEARFKRQSPCKGLSGFLFTFHSFVSALLCKGNWGRKPTFLLNQRQHKPKQSKMDLTFSYHYATAKSLKNIFSYGLGLVFFVKPVFLSRALIILLASYNQFAESHAACLLGAVAQQSRR